MKKSGRHWFKAHRIEISVAVIFCLIGFIVGVATRYDLQWGTRFDEEINSVQLLQLICTVILAWLVTTVLDKQKQAEKTVKEIILKRAEELHSFVHDTAIKFSSGEFLYTDAASAAKRINVATDRICKLLEANKITCDAQIKTNIVAQADKMLDLMTNTPVHDPKATAPPVVEVKNGKLHFREDRALEIENAFEDLKHHIMSLQLSIINS